MTAHRRFDDAVLIAGALLAGLVPLCLGGYELKLATSILVQAGLAAALGLVVGPAGLVSLGHAAFYGVAAYALAMLAPADQPADLILSFAASVALAAAAAAVVGALSIRSRGLYFILMTLAFGQFGYHLFNDTGIGGSADGAYVNFRPELHVAGIAVPLENARDFYLLVLVVVAAVVATTWWLRRSAVGQILAAMRDNQPRVRAFGFSPYRLRLAVFVVSGTLAGAAGYLAAAQHGFVTPSMLSWHLSATALVMVLIGGKDTVSGPVVGAVVLLMAEEWLQRLTPHWLVGVGVIVIAVVLVAPHGLVPAAADAAGSAATQLRHRIKRWRHG